MKFTVNGLIFLGFKKGISKRTQKEYCMVSLLTSDNNVVQCFTDKRINAELKKFDRVDVEFNLSIGRSQYKLTVNDIRKN